jgi:flagellar biosynthesis protein FlhG
MPTPAFLDAAEPPSFVPPKGTRRLIAVGGGRGGVGKSLISVNLSVYLAQLGRNVVLVDADLAGANLHTLLGIEAPPEPARDQIESGKVPLVDTPIPGLKLLGAMVDFSALSGARPGKRSRWAELLRQMPAEFVVLDLGSGVAPGTLDLFSMADVGICVTLPEPPAIESTYRFLRALFARRLRRALMKERFKLKIVERLLAAMPTLPLPLDVVQQLGRSDPTLAQIALGELSRLYPKLVVNGTRVRTDNDLGHAMQAMADRYLGIELEYIGHIEQDDAVWLTVRRRRPLLIDSPTSKSARHIERMSRRIVALSAVREARPQPPGPIDRRLTLYDVLGLSRGASDEEVRRAHKRQRELFSVDSLPLISILSGAQLRAEQARIEEAHDTLLDPNKRRAYDLSVFPETSHETPQQTQRRSFSSEQLQVQAELAREIQTATEFSGVFLRRIRESQGLELAEIASRTKISLTHLRAIEEEQFGELPAIVYVRGFVREVAKLLKLDPAHVDRTYLKRLREGFAALGRPLE